MDATRLVSKFLASVKRAYQAAELRLPESLQPPALFQALLDGLYRKSWVVYSKAPFAGPEQVLAYLARYTHRVAISNHRLLHIDGGRVGFTYNDYNQGGGGR